MWVATNDVERVIDWFFRRSKAPFLALFVAGDPKFDQLLADVIAQRNTIDILLGPVVELVLLSNRRLDADDRVTRVGDISEWKTDDYRNVVDATAMSTSQIATALHLGIDDLPALLIFRRRRRPKRAVRRPAEPLILRLRGAEDAAFLIDFLRAFRRTIERFERGGQRGSSLLLSDDQGMEAKDALAEHHRQEAADRLQKLERFADTVASEVGADGAQQARLRQISETVVDRDAFRAGLIRELGPKQLRTFDAWVAGDVGQRKFAKWQKARRGLDNERKRELVALGMSQEDERLEELIELGTIEREEIEAVIRKFERKLSYALLRDRVYDVLGLSIRGLKILRKGAKALAALKSGGLTSALD